MKRQSHWDLRSPGQTKVQSFGGLVDDKVLFVYAYGEDIEVTNSFIYHGSIVQNNCGSCQEVI